MGDSHVVCKDNCTYTTFIALWRSHPPYKYKANMEVKEGEAHGWEMYNSFL